MKKLCKKLGVCIGFPLINLIIVGILQSILMVLTKNIEGATNKYLYLVVLVGNLVTLAVIALILIPSKESLIRNINVKIVGTKELIYTILLSIGLSFILLSLTGVLTSLVPSYKAVQGQLSTINTSFLMIIVGVILIPIYEEIFYRGIIFGYLKKQYSIVIAVFVQALIFSIMHFNFVQSTYTFLLGLVLGLIYIYTESIIGNIIMHITFNLLGTVIIPKLSATYPLILTVFITIGIILFIFSSLKILKKYDDILYSK